MKNKLRIGALLLTAVMLTSTVYESAPIVVRAEEQTEQEALQTVSSGDAKEESAEVTDAISVYATEETETPIAVVTYRIHIYGGKITLDPKSTWSDLSELNKYGENIGLTKSTPLKSGAYVTMDVLIPDDVTFTGTLKLQGAARLGSNWEWTAATDDCKDITMASLGEAKDGFYRIQVTYHFDEKVEADVLSGFTVKPAGYLCDFSGDIYLENIKLYDGTGSEEAGTTSKEVLVGEVADRKKVYEKDVTFDQSSDWDEQGHGGGYDINLTTNAPLHTGSYVTMDVVIPQTADYKGSIKVQGIARLGSNWKWTQSNVIAELTKDDFKKLDDDYSVATIKIPFDTAVEEDKLCQLTIKVVGYLCDYSGPIYIENVKLYDKQTSGEKPALPEKDPSVIDDFEDGTCEDWKKVEGWQYTNTVNNTVTDYNGSKMMKVDLDYTGMSSYSWSEAKLENKFAVSYDISAYNLISFDYYYPAAMSGSKIKLFSNSGINSEAKITEEETLADGMIRAKVQLKFSPTDKGLEDLTIGFVGVNTEFVGSVYVDNITLSQYNEAGDFVKITAVPKEKGTQADTSKAPSEVRLSDADAGTSAKALYAYLMSLRENDQVLFGHENDINKMVSSTATEGDVKEITGSVSGLYGIDTLALTGAELGIKDAEKALNQAIAYSKQAAAQGAVITLSSHMPNFSNEKITVNADESYNFTACDFSESKDTSNNCAEQILPGGAYNDRFTAYLDIIAEYANALQEDNIPVLFRPYHENTGSWFWWGSSTGVETYKSLWCYTQEYLQSKGVHNMIYVYSPNGPLTGRDEYLSRYPGDEYVDVLAFDYYDDYSTYPASFDDSFFNNLRTTCDVVSGLAAEKRKVAAISETGVRVMKENGSDYEGLLVNGNPIARHNWYQQVSNIAAECDMPYWLVWANFGDTNFYVPYKYNNSYGQELINEFIDFYNSDSSIFGNGTNFYNNEALKNVTGQTYHTAQGYLIAPFELAAIKEETTFRASVKNAEKVSFVVTNPENGKEITLEAAKAADSRIREYAATFTAQMLAEIGQTDTATVSLVADGTVLATVKNISLGKDKDKAAANVIDNFDYYAGNDGLLQSSYAENSAGGCSSSFSLSGDHKADGSFGGAFRYQLNTTKNEVWTGQNKTLDDLDLSSYNAITMWVDPDGMGQKLVIQLADDSGEEFEVYLSDFVKGTEASYVTIPFSSFKGKKNGTLNTAKLTKFAIWCNSIIPKGHTGEWKVDSVIYFDGIEAFTADDALLAQADANGLIYTKESPIKREDPAPEETKPEEAGQKEPTGNNTSAGSGSSASSEEVTTVNWNGVQNQITDANDKNVNLNFVSTGETKVPATILNSVKNSNATIAFHSGSGLALSISGQDLKNVDLTKIQDIELTAKRNGDLITVKDTGSFAVPVNMHINVGKENVGKYANLYRRNTENGQWEYCGSFGVTENGQAMFALYCGGEYRVSVTDEAVKESVVFKGGSYEVKAGDTLSRIAAKHKITLAELLRKNPQIKNVNKIQIGQDIRIR